jgi:hypothetical protein
MEILVPESCYDRAQEIIESHLDEDAQSGYEEDEKKKKTDQIKKRGRNNDWRT